MRGIRVYPEAIRLPRSVTVLHLDQGHVVGGVYILGDLIRPSLDLVVHNTPKRDTEAQYHTVGLLISRGSV
jgi:hypothetical protein